MVHLNANCIWSCLTCCFDTKDEGEAFLREAAAPVSAEDLEIQRLIREGNELDRLLVEASIRALLWERLLENEGRDER